MSASDFGRGRPAWPARRRVGDPLAPLRARFEERIAAPRPWVLLAVDAPRLLVAVAFALLPPLLLLAMAHAAGPGVLESFTRGEHVRDAFARLIGAVATASAIAASVAAIALDRGLRGTGTARQHREENEAFLDRLTEPGSPLAPGAGASPSLADLMAVAMDRLRREASRVRDLATPEAERADVDGVDLRTFLATLEVALQREADTLRAPKRRRSPTLLFLALMDFDEALADNLARRYASHPGVDARTRDGLARLRKRLGDVVVGTTYAKTMEMQWGLSRMTVVILLCLVPALVAATGASLAYHDGIPAAWGLDTAALLVAALLAVVLLPLGAIVSYLLRFVVLNQYTLTTPGIRLGPESAGA